MEFRVESAMCQTAQKHGGQSVTSELAPLRDAYSESQLVAYVTFSSYRGMSDTGAGAVSDYSAKCDSFTSL
jgi:hypothetical protein